MSCDNERDHMIIIPALAVVHHGYQLFLLTSSMLHTIHSNDNHGNSYIPLIDASLFLRFRNRYLGLSGSHGNSVNWKMEKSKERAKSILHP